MADLRRGMRDPMLDVLCGGRTEMTISLPSWWRENLRAEAEYRRKHEEQLNELAGESEPRFSGRRRWIVGAG